MSVRHILSRAEKRNMQKAKIVCTIGAACDSMSMLDRLIVHGMDAARLNFSQ